MDRLNFAANPTDSFSSRVPDFGDPTLIEQRRRQYIPFDVIPSSS